MSPHTAGPVTNADAVATLVNHLITVSLTVTAPGCVPVMDDPRREIDDTARRASDIVNLYIHGMRWDDLKDKYLAIRLSNGDSDGVLYDTKRDAVRHQLHESQCAYLSFRTLGPGGATAKDMAIFLNFCRDAYDKGMRLTDPDDMHGGREVIPTAGQIDYHTRRYNADRLGLIILPGGTS